MCLDGESLGNFYGRMAIVPSVRLVCIKCSSWMHLHWILNSYCDTSKGVSFLVVSSCTSLSPSSLPFPMLWYYAWIRCYWFYWFSLPYKAQFMKIDLKVNITEVFSWYKYLASATAVLASTEVIFWFGRAPNRLQGFLPSFIVSSLGL